MSGVAGKISAYMKMVLDAQGSGGPNGVNVKAGLVWMS
jgi:hypothetical protein